jgi:hypothetical protein
MRKVASLLRIGRCERMAKTPLRHNALITYLLLQEAEADRAAAFPLRGGGTNVRARGGVSTVIANFLRCGWQFRRRILAWR